MAQVEFEEKVWKNDGWPSIFLANFAGKVGPSGRTVTHGDILGLDEIGHGVEHGTVFKLPSDRGLVALTRAACSRVRALESLIVTGTPDEISFEAAQIAKASREEKV